MINRTNSNKLKKFLKQHKKAVKEFVTVMGVEAKNHFVKSFRNQGFTDEVLKPWPARKYNRNSRGRGILVKTGDLRRSIRVIRQKRYGIVIGSDLRYASIHNYGGLIHKKARTATLNFRVGRDGKSRFARANKANFQQTVRIDKHSIRMPQRKFIGNSSVLTRRLSTMLRSTIRNAFRTR